MAKRKRISGKIKGILKPKVFNPNNHFYYKRQYSSYLDTKRKKSDAIKFRLRKYMSQSKWLSRFFDEFEIHSLGKEKFIDTYLVYREAFNFEEEEAKPFVYDRVYLREICYYEALEIDDIDNYRSSILAKFNKNKPFTYSSKEDLKKSLDDVKRKFDTIGWGKLFYINFSKQKNKGTDLISSVKVSYIKTQESFFVLRFAVTPSPKFDEIVKKIVNSSDLSLTVDHYLPFGEILKTRRFISPHTFINSVKNQGIENVISDLNYQLKKTVLKRFQGYFQKGIQNARLPSVEVYEVGNLLDFHKDNDILESFSNHFQHKFVYEAKGIEIYISRGRNNENRIKIVKEIGEKTSKTIDKIDDSFYIETYGLLESLGFPCVFQAILYNENEVLNDLKRKVHDFVRNARKINMFNPILFFKQNRRYFELKQKLTEVLYTTKRFESDFTEDNLHTYTKEFDLRHFIGLDWDRKTPKNLLAIILEDFSWQLKTLKTKTSGTNEIFKIIEELNSFKTNFLLQVLSFLVALLAFVFTFDKGKKLVILILDSISSFWQYLVGIFIH